MRKYVIPFFALLMLAAYGCDPVAVEPEEPKEPDVPVEPETPGKLTGTVIGTKYSVDYNSGSKSTTVNTKDNVFDGDYDTFFASYDRSQTWVGLDLGEKHVITRDSRLALIISSEWSWRCLRVRMNLISVMRFRYIL